MLAFPNIKCMGKLLCLNILYWEELWRSSHGIHLHQQWFRLRSALTTVRQIWTKKFIKNSTNHFLYDILTHRRKQERKQKKKLYWKDRHLQDKVPWEEEITKFLSKKSFSQTDNGEQNLAGSDTIFEYSALLTPSANGRHEHEKLRLNISYQIPL